MIDRDRNFEERYRPASRGEAGGKRADDYPYRRRRRGKPSRYRLKCKALYASEDWKVLRADVLAEHPVCELCLVRVAQHVDHIIPHRGEQDPFFDRDNLQAICVKCHARKSARHR